MVNLPVKKLRPGMITAQSIYNSAGGSYITSGATVNEQYIDRLKKLGVQSLTVTSLNPDVRIKPPPDVINEQTRMAAIKSVAQTFENLEKGMLEVKPIEKTSEKILHDILDNAGSLVQLTDIRVHDSYTFAHCVNVAVISGMVGQHLGLEHSELLTLIMGALLHDNGKVGVPGEVLNKPGSLDDGEMAIVRRHPIIGRDRLLKLDHPDSRLLARIAGEHHEHMDGKGYPAKLTEKSIHKFSRIVALADVYDALTSDRPYSAAYRPHIAHKIMTKFSPGHFDLELLDKFFDTIALYPIGTIIKTNKGYAIVKTATFGRTLLPVVVLFADSLGRLYPQPQTFDLNATDELKIDNVIEDSEIFSLSVRLRVDPNSFIKDD